MVRPTKASEKSDIVVNRKDPERENREQEQKKKQDGRKADDGYDREDESRHLDLTG